MFFLMHCLPNRGLQSDSVCCKLQTGCKLNTLISKRKATKFSLQFSSLQNPLQTEKAPNKTTGYEEIQIAHGVPPTYGREWCVNPLTRFTHHLGSVFCVAMEGGR